jgi:hypothetical protein
MQPGEAFSDSVIARRLLPLQLIDFSQYASILKVIPMSLVCLMQITPVAPILLYPLCDPLSSFLALSQTKDLLAQSRLIAVWFLLRPLTGSNAFWAVSDALHVLGEVVQQAVSEAGCIWLLHCVGSRLFSTAYGISHKKFHQAFIAKEFKKHRVEPRFHKLVTLLLYSYLS